MAGQPVKNQILAQTEEILDRIANGETQTEIAKSLGVTCSYLVRVLNASDEASRRARAAKESSAEILYDRAHEELKSLASDGTQADIARAKELAQHYRKMAAIRNPREYGDRVDISGTINHEHSVAALFQLIQPQADLLGHQAQPPGLIQDADYEPI